MALPGIWGGGKQLSLPSPEAGAVERPESTAVTHADSLRMVVEELLVTRWWDTKKSRKEPMYILQNWRRLVRMKWSIVSKASLRLRELNAVVQPFPAPTYPYIFLSLPLFPQLFPPFPLPRSEVQGSYPRNFLISSLLYVSFKIFSQKETGFFWSVYSRENVHQNITNNKPVQFAMYGPWCGYTLRLKVCGRVESKPPLICARWPAEARFYNSFCTLEWIECWNF